MPSLKRWLERMLHSMYMVIFYNKKSLYIFYINSFVITLKLYFLVICYLKRGCVSVYIDIHYEHILYLLSNKKTE